MSIQDHLLLLLGIASNVALLQIFFSQIPTVMSIVKQQRRNIIILTLELGYLIIFFTCINGMVIGNVLAKTNIFVILPSMLLGFVLEHFFCTFAPLHIKARTGVKRRVMGMVGAGLMHLMLFHVETDEFRWFLGACFFMVMLIALYLCPISFVRNHVFNPRFEDYLPLLIASLNAFNDLTLLTYSLVEGELFIVIGSGIYFSISIGYIFLSNFAEKNAAHEEDFDLDAPLIPV